MIKYSCLECGRHVYTDTVCQYVKCGCGELMYAKRMKGTIQDEPRKKD